MIATAYEKAAKVRIVMMSNKFHEATKIVLALLK
jgi:hypothetical protein